MVRLKSLRKSLKLMAMARWGHGWFMQAGTNDYASE